MFPGVPLLDLKKGHGVTATTLAGSAGRDLPSAAAWERPRVDLEAPAELALHNNPTEGSKFTLGDSPRYYYYSGESVPDSESGTIPKTPGIHFLFAFCLDA